MRGTERGDEREVMQAKDTEFRSSRDDGLSNDIFNSIGLDALRQAIDNCFILNAV